MDLLLINVSPSKEDYIINKSIKNNVGIYSAQNTAEVHKIITTKEITHLYIDLMSKNIDWLNFLKELRMSEDGHKYQVIVTSNRKERDFIQALLYLGIVGFIPSDIGVEKTFDKLNKILKITQNRDTRRKHFRVSIPKTDDVKVNFKLPKQDKLITGQVTDISIVAMAIRLDTPSDYNSYSAGTTIDKVQLKINNRFALLTIKIIKPGPITIAALPSLSDNALNLLSQYVFEGMKREVMEPPQQDNE